MIARTESEIRDKIEELSYIFDIFDGIRIHYERSRLDLYPPYKRARKSYLYPLQYDDYISYGIIIASNVTSSLVDATSNATITHNTAGIPGQGIIHSILSVPLLVRISCSSKVVEIIIITTILFLYPRAYQDSIKEITHFLLSANRVCVIFQAFLAYFT